jgi:preprotein translocase subunit SecA
VTRVGLTKVAPRRGRKVGPAHQLKRQIPAVFDTKPLAPLRAICPSVKAAVWHDWHAQTQRIEGRYEIVAARFEGGAPALVFGQAVGLEAGQELEHPLLNRSIQTAQKRVEQHNFQARKRTLEYDDVMNKQREIVYGFRNEIIRGHDVRDRLMDIMEEVVLAKVDEFTSHETEISEWDIRGLADWVNLNFPIGMPEEKLLKTAEDGGELPVPGSAFEGLNASQFAVCHFLAKSVRDAYDLKIQFEDAEALKNVERYIVLSAIDKLWQEHLYGMDSLRTSIGLRAYGQRDPLIEYKSEAFKLFDELMVNIKTEICHNIFRSASSMVAFENFLKNLPAIASHSASAPYGAEPPVKGNPSDMVSEASDAMSKATPMRTGPKVGRNDPCPCGSGKKYKQCCGR